MGKKVRERKAREKQEKNKRLTRVFIFAAIAVCVAGVLVFSAVYDPNKPAYEVKTFQIEKNADGSLSVPRSELSAKLIKIDFGYEQKLLARVDDIGVVRTAYDTCQECFASGNVYYTLKGRDEIVCSACGNVYPIASLELDSWGGCQPISIPPKYRQDNETEIIIPKEVLAFAEGMFEQWKIDDYSQTLENYAQ